MNNIIDFKHVNLDNNILEDSSIGPICKKFLGIEERYASLTEEKLMSTAYMSTGFLRYITKSYNKLILIFGPYLYFVYVSQVAPLDIFSSGLICVYPSSIFLFKPFAFSEELTIDMYMSLLESCWWVGQPD